MKYSQDIINKIIQEYMDGRSVYHLHKKHNIDCKTIQNWLDKNNIPTNYTGRFEQRYEILSDCAKIYIKSENKLICAIIDIDDVDRCKQVGIWSIGKNGYVTHCGSGIYLHRFIMNCPDNMEVDHIYHDPLDNRKSKLRICDSTEQKFNTKIRSDNTSGHRGVYYDKERNTWNVHLCNRGKRFTKRCKTYDEAVAVCEQKIEEWHKDFMYKEGEQNQN